MKVNINYFSDNFGETIKQITVKLEKLYKIFNTDIPSDFEFSGLMNRLIEDTEQALDAKTKLNDDVTEMAGALQDIENQNIQQLSDFLYGGAKVSRNVPEDNDIINDYGTLNAMFLKDLQGNKAKTGSFVVGHADIKKGKESSLKNKKKFTKEVEKFANETAESLGEIAGRYASLVRDIIEKDPKQLGNDILDDVEFTGANFVNSYTATWKGILGFAENIIDFMLTKQGFEEALALKMVGADKLADMLSSNTAAVVSVDWIGVIFDALYETNAAKAIDKKATKGLKYETGTMFELDKMLGYLLPFIVTEILTKGAATVGTAAMQGASTGGDFAEHNLQYKQLNSIKGIQYAHEHNKITDEEYTKIMVAYELYRASGLSDIEWLENANDSYKQGIISEEMYNIYSKVATFEEDWDNFESVSRTTIGAIVVGVADGIAAYTGAMLNKWAGFGSNGGVVSDELIDKLATGAFRIAADSALGYLNPIYHSVGDSIANKEDFSTAYSKRGGIEASKKMALFAASLSATNEVARVAQGNKNGNPSSNVPGKKEKYIVEQKEKFAKLITEEQGFAGAYKIAKENGDLDILTELINETDTRKEFLQSNLDTLSQIADLSAAERKEYMKYAATVGKSEISDIYGEELGNKFSNLTDDGSMNAFDIEQIVNLSPKSNVDKAIIQKEAENMAKILDVVEDDGYIYGIHRTGGNVSGEVLEKEGIVLTGHTSSGVGNAGSTNDSVMDKLELNVSFYEKKGQVISDIKKSKTYKNLLEKDVDVAIVAIPKNMTEEELAANVVIKANGQEYLNPDYIVGYATVDYDTGAIIDYVPNQ